MTTSHWTQDMPVFPALTRDADADVVVIGGGIAGLTCAYLLAGEGQRVVLLEPDALGSGETARTSAQLTASLDFRYVELAGIHGEDRARLIAGSHTAAIDEIERIVRDEQIDCSFARVPSYLFAPPDGRDDLERELHAMHSAGLDVHLVAAPDGTRHLGPCVRLAHQGAFHPLQYLRGLARACNCTRARRSPGTTLTRSSQRAARGCARRTWSSPRTCRWRTG